MVNKYIPQKGDLVWLDFQPSSGKEILKRRPALTLSPSYYNKKGLALFCPVTSKDKSYNKLNVTIKHNNIQGTVITEQLRSLDWHARNAKFIAKLDIDTLLNVIENIQVILNADEL